MTIMVYKQQKIAFNILRDGLINHVLLFMQKPRWDKNLS
jgi:hypothetical protein